MSAVAETPETTSMGEERKRGLRWKTLVTRIVALGLSLTAITSLARSRAEAAYRRDTLERLRSQSDLLFRPHGFCFPPPLASGSGRDATGQGLLILELKHRNWSLNHFDTKDPPASAFGFLHFAQASTGSRCAVCIACRGASGSFVDAWGNPIYYRCPGPIHKNGWDLISCGPNGVYEEGGGDDIVVGQDLPNGIAAIESGR